MRCFCVTRWWWSTFLRPSGGTEPADANLHRAAGLILITDVETFLHVLSAYFTHCSGRRRSSEEVHGWRMQRVGVTEEEAALGADAGRWLVVAPPKGRQEWGQNFFRMIFFIVFYLNRLFCDLNVCVHNQWRSWAAVWKTDFIYLKFVNTRRPVCTEFNAGFLLKRPHTVSSRESSRCACALSDLTYRFEGSKQRSHSGARAVTVLRLKL